MLQQPPTTYGTVWLVPSDLASSDETVSTCVPLVERLRAAQLPSPRERRRIRERAGATLRDVAQELGVNPMSVHGWERGAQPRREHAIAYRRLLDRLDEVAQ